MNSSPRRGSTEAAGTPDATPVADRLLEVVPRTMRRIRTEMRGRAPGDLTVPQLRALLHVRRRPGEGLSPLADHLGMSAPAASALVDRLVRAGLVDRAADPAERRRIQLRLTAEGSEQVARSHLAVRSWLRDELAHLTPAELEQLAGALEVLDGLAKDRR